MIQDIHPGSGSGFFYPSLIPVPGVKKAPDPGSATPEEIKQSVVHKAVHCSARIRFYFSFLLKIKDKKELRLNSAVRRTRIIPTSGGPNRLRGTTSQNP
jgi:hypothetical protein